MRKIGIFLQAELACGGTYQYNKLILDALESFAQKKYEIIAYYASPHWKEVLQKKQICSKYIKINRFWSYLAGGWRRMKLSMRGWRKLAKYCHPLAKAMLNEKCELWIFPSQDAYAYLLPVNTLATVHDLMHRYERRFPEVGENREYAIREFHYRNTCRWAKGILVDSQLGKEQLIESYQVPSQKCHVLPYIASPEIGLIYSKDFDKKYHLPQKFLFYPAQFWAHKNHQNLLKALAKCKQWLPEIQLVLVGSQKNAYSTVEKLILELAIKEHVHLLGLVEEQDLPELYRRARALIMPTYFGPTNIPPLEAFALDCPIGISDVYGMRAQLGDAALYFQPDSVDEIANIMTTLWQDDDLCKMLIQKGKIKHKQYSFEAFALKLEKIIDAL